MRFEAFKQPAPTRTAQEEAAVEAITEKSLQRAAQRAVERGHVVAAILFGSRARGTADAHSDWDVCLVTNDDAARAGRDMDAALAAEDPLWAHGKVQTFWAKRSEFDNGVHANNVREAIAREGRVLAGDREMTRNVEVKPFKASDLQYDMGRGMEHLVAGVNAARRHAQAGRESTRRQATVDMSLNAIAAAEALGRALCALTGVRHSGTHDLKTNGERILAAGAEGEARAERSLRQQIGERLIAMNGGVRALRGAEYREVGETYDAAARRLSLALETDAWIRDGLIRGKGPWARLSAHLRSAELRGELMENTSEGATMNARSWTLMPVTIKSEELNAAVGEWVMKYQAIKIAERESTHAKSKVDGV